MATSRSRYKFENYCARKCFLCGEKVVTIESERLCKKRALEFPFDVTCCDSCKQLSPVVLFVHGFVIGQAVSCIIESFLISSSHTQRRSAENLLVSRSQHVNKDSEISRNDLFVLEHLAESKTDNRYNEVCYTENGVQSKASVCAFASNDISKNQENVQKTIHEFEEDTLSDQHCHSECTERLHLSPQNNKGSQYAYSKTRKKHSEQSTTPREKNSTKKRNFELISHKYVKDPVAYSSKSSSDKGKSSIPNAICLNQDNDFPVTETVKSQKLPSKQRLVVQCSICYQLIAKFMLARHVKTKHPGQDIVADSTFHCKDCGDKFETLNSLQAHRDREHLVMTNFKCKMCSKSFSKIRNLSLHTRLRHKVAFRKECNICGESFLKWEELPKHRFKVHGVSDHPCHICGKSFVHEQALNAHVDAHTGIKKFFCEICGKGFVRFTNFCSHKLIHKSKSDSKLDLSGDEKTQSKSSHPKSKRNCALCVKAVVTKSVVCSLHSGPSMTRSHVCSVCGKGFASSSHLSAHSKQHSEPRFSCDICARCFTYKCNLKTHRLSHLPLASKRIFHCRHCSKTFNTQYNLSLHERTHDDVAYYSCFVCGKGFSRSSNLYRHIRTMHPDHATANPAGTISSRQTQ